MAENAPVLDINKTEEELSFKNHVYHPEAYRQYCNEKLAANEAQNNKFSPVTRSTSPICITKLIINGNYIIVFFFNRNRMVGFLILIWNLLAYETPEHHRNLHHSVYRVLAQYLYQQLATFNHQERQLPQKHRREINSAKVLISHHRLWCGIS